MAHTKLASVQEGYVRVCGERDEAIRLKEEETSALQSALEKVGLLLFTALGSPV